MTGVCITGSIGIVLAVIAAVVDGISAAVFHDFTGCCNGDHTCWGTNAGKAVAYACVGNYYYSGDASKCYCTDATTDSSSYTCWDYTLSSGTDCNKVLTTYADELSASTAFLSFGAICLLILSVTTCAALCCAKPTTVNTTPNPSATAPPVVVVSPIGSTPAMGQAQVAYVVEPTKY